MANLRGEFGRAEDHVFHTRQILADEEQLQDIAQREVDGIVAALGDRTKAAEPGVETGAITGIDPEFDVESFLAIARETFLKVRDARKRQNPQESAELLSPQMQRDLQDAISGDVAAHRHHLLPFLTITDAVIASAQVSAGQEEIDVLLSVSAAEEDLQDGTGQVLAGDDVVRSWAERWTFTRDPRADTSASDLRHEISPDPAGEWLVAHRGWIVTGITRLPAS